MKLTAQTLLVLADGQKAMFLRNQGHNGQIRLEKVQTFTLDNLASHELGWDRPGRAYSRCANDSRRSAYESSDPHEQGEMRFLEDLARAIDGALASDGYQRVVLMAPPRALGILRQALSPAAQQRVQETVPKDYLKTPMAELEQMLMRSLP